MPPYNQLIIEDVISSMDTVPIVELTVETEKEARSKIMEENGKVERFFESTFSFLLELHLTCWLIMVVVIFSDKNVRLSNEEKKVPNLPETTAKVPINSVSIGWKVT